MIPAPPRACLMLTMAMVIALLAGCREGDFHASAPGSARKANGPPHPLWAATATLRPVDGNIGNGFAEVTYFDNGMIALNIRANLAPPEKGRYTAWLLNNASHAINAGRLRSPKADGTYFLNTEHEAKDLRLYSDHRRILVAWEPSGSGNHGAPEETVIEGTLTVVQETD